MVVILYTKEPCGQDFSPKRQVGGLYLYPRAENTNALPRKTICPKIFWQDSLVW